MVQFIMMTCWFQILLILVFVSSAQAQISLRCGTSISVASGKTYFGKSTSMTADTAINYSSGKGLAESVSLEYLHKGLLGVSVEFSNFNGSKKERYEISNSKHDTYSFRWNSIMASLGLRMLHPFEKKRGSLGTSLGFVTAPWSHLYTTITSVTPTSGNLNTTYFAEVKITTRMGFGYYGAISYERPFTKKLKWYVPAQYTMLTLRYKKGELIEYKEGYFSKLNTIAYDDRFWNYETVLTHVPNQHNQLAYQISAGSVSLAKGFKYEFKKKNPW